MWPNALNRRGKEIVETSRERTLGSDLFIDIKASSLELWTKDQRVLGDERFVEKVKERGGRRELGGRRRHEYTLMEIGGAVERVYGTSLRQLREKGKGEWVQTGRRVLSLVGREYGYKGGEIGEYLRKDPSVVTRYLKEARRFEGDIKKVHEDLKKQSQ